MFSLEIYLTFPTLVQVNEGGVRLKRKAPRKKGGETWGLEPHAVGEDSTVVSLDIFIVGMSLYGSNHFPIK